MGADIHCYLEYTDFNDREGNPYWSCFGGRNNLGRDYWMFDVLAGVRGSGEPHIPLKGLPPGKKSWQVESDAYLIISDENPDMEGYCSLANAETWSRQGDNTIEEHGNGGKRVTHPDWHSHTWLTADELAQCLGVYMLRHQDTYSVTWDAMLASMRAFEERGVQTRLVLWFDN